MCVEMIIQNERLSVRRLHEKDLPMLVKWLSDHRVLQFYEGRDNHFDYEKVHNKFYKRTDEVTRCIVEYYEREIGYIQFYPLNTQTKLEYGYKDNSELIFGIDQFIGEVDFWNKGVGQLLIQSMTSYLIENHDAERIVMDPQKENTRAIKCYEKCHFSKIKSLPQHEFHEGNKRDCYLLEYKSK